MLAYLTKLGSNLLDLMVKRFSNPRTARRNRFILLFATAVLLTVILLPGQRFSSTEFKPGDIATSDIRAPHDFLVEDRALTEQRRKEAGNNAPVVYNLSDRIPSYIISKLEQVVAAVRKEAAAKNRKSADEWRTQLVPLLDTELSEAEIRAFTHIASDRVFLADAGRMVNELYRHRIVLDGKAFQTDTRRGVEFINDDGRLVEDSDAAVDYTEIREARRLVTSWQFSGRGDRHSPRDRPHPPPEPLLQPRGVGGPGQEGHGGGQAGTFQGPEG